MSAAFASLVQFLGTIIPQDVAGQPNDGAEILLVCRGGREAERQAAVVSLDGLVFDGVRASEWPESLVMVAAAPPDGSYYALRGLRYAYWWAMDRGEIVEAGVYLDRALAAADRYSDVSRPVVYLEAAYYTALHRGDAATARRYLGQSKPSLLVRRYSELLAESAILLAEANYAAALNRAREAVKAIECSGDAKRAESQILTLNQIVARCEAALSSAEAEPKQPR
jgi:hypothetical protein